MVKDAATENGLKFAGPNDKESEWYGTAAPYLNFFVGFKMRMEELRIGHNVMPIKREGGNSKVFPV